MTWSSTSARTSTSCFTQFVRVAAAAREQRIAGQRSVRRSAWRSGRASRPSGPTRRGRASSRASRGARRGALISQHRGLAGRKVDAAVVRSATRPRPCGPRCDSPKRSQFCQSSAATDGRAPAPASDDGDEHDAQADRCTGDETSAIAQAATTIGQSAASSASAPIAIVFRAGRIVAGHADSRRDDRCGEERPAAGGDRDRESRTRSAARIDEHVQARYGSSATNGGATA